MKKKINKDSLKFKIIVFTVYVILIAGLTVALIPLAKLLTSEGGMERFKNILESYKAFGIIIFTLVQAVQVLVVIVPPVQIVGGMLFGGILGSIFSLIGLWAGSALVFWLVKTTGAPLVHAIISKKNIKKFSFFENTDKICLITFVLYLIPGTPKDALTYIVPLTNLDMKRFLLMVMPARIPAIVISAFFGSCIQKGQYTATIIIAVVMVLFGIFGFLYRDKIVEKMKKLVKHSGKHSENSEK